MAGMRLPQPGVCLLSIAILAGRAISNRRNSSASQASSL